MEDWRI